MKDFFSPYISELITAIVAGFGGWFLNRRRKAAERKLVEANAIEGLQNVYQKFVQDADEKFKELHAEIDELKAEMERVKAYWRNRYNKLKNEFERYKTKHP